MLGLSLVVASGGHSSSRCAGLSLSRPLLLRSTGSRRTGSVIVAHGPSCSAACGIFPDQGSNPCPLHWQADSQPLCHQGSPIQPLLIKNRGTHQSLISTKTCQRKQHTLKRKEYRPLSSCLGRVPESFIAPSTRAHQWVKCYPK